MSELLIEHPVVFIEDLLKLGIGDEGRLLYLRKAITNGKTVYDSDKKFLKKMYLELDKIKSSKSVKSHNPKSNNTGNKTNFLPKNKYQTFKPSDNYTDDQNSQSEEFNSGITKPSAFAATLMASVTAIL